MAHRTKRPEAGYYYLKPIKSGKNKGKYKRQYVLSGTQSDIQAIQWTLEQYEPDTLLQDIQDRLLKGCKMIQDLQALIDAGYTRVYQVIGQEE